ncbi:cytochrome P450 family protein [Streptomonospora wellingtoniae]|uniref:Cytochrome P450 n=1 Tax=Streptomonospora wellingtoniae TaxID=3075544 RepID=A0ABU2KSJ8_9ACTN|nr:cytochrome P450 [Streptomonospora sp. DSM 45055]MDT0302152.1 cytochrome P450 [Streptomonospora sp. DSM 45055]
MSTPTGHDSPADDFGAVALTDPALLADPYAGYGRLRETEPVAPARNMDGSHLWIVTRHDDVRTVLDDPRFANDPLSVPGIETDKRADLLIAMGLPAEYVPYIADTVLDTDPPDHTRLRKLVSRAFTVRRVGELRPRVEQITDDLLDALPAHAEADGTVDLVEHFAYPLPITVICEMVGVPEADRPLWRRWGADLVQSQSPERMGTALVEMVDHIGAMVEQRRAEPGDDLLDALISVGDEDGDRLTGKELITLVLTLVIAGHETTANLIGNGTLALLSHPDQLALLRRDAGTAPRAVHELMRWCGPILGTRPRWATEDVTLGGKLIRRGEPVMAMIVGANRDPRRFEDPDRLDIARAYETRGEQHTGFGHGMHYCLGAALARQEGEVAFTRLFERYPELSLAVAEHELEWLPRPGLRRLIRLPVHLGRG